MESNTDKIQDALQFFLYCITNHRANQREYEDFFNYEDFAQEQFKVTGRGFVFLNATEFVKGHLEGGTNLTGIDYKYFTFDSAKDWESPVSEALEALSQYDASKYYVVLVLAETKKLPKSFTTGVSQNTVLVTGIPLTKAPAPSRISNSQIRKRLKRMVQQGIRLLVLDTNEPDCMGANLGKWLVEIKALEEEGQYFNVMIDGDEDSSALIPAHLKKDIHTLTFK